MNSCFTKFIIFFTAVFMFPLAVFGQATFSSNMSKVEGASDETKERLIKNCDENTDCVGVINQNIFAIANQEIMFTPFPEITQLPPDQVEDFASYEVQKHLMKSGMIYCFIANRRCWKPTTKPKKMKITAPCILHIIKKY